MVYMITYDLNSPGQKYDDLIDSIEACSDGVCYSCWRSSYLIQTNKTARQIAEKLYPHIDNNDTLFIAEITDNCEGWIPEKDIDIVKNMLEQA